jgi:hypothetical protein
MAESMSDLRERTLKSALAGRAWRALTNDRRDGTSSGDGLVDIVDFPIRAAIASDTKRRQPITNLGRLPAHNIAQRLLHEMPPRRAPVSSIEYNARSISRPPGFSHGGDYEPTRLS